MNETYGFIEEWLAETIGIEYIGYPLESGKSIAAIDHAGYSRVLTIIGKLWKDLGGSEPNLTPVMVNSVVMNMKTVLHVYWSDDDVLDEITGEDAKDVLQYGAIKALGPSGARFNMDTVKNAIGVIINPESESEDSADANANGEAVPADDTVEADDSKNEKDEKKDAPKPISDSQRKINDFIEHIVDIRPGEVYWQLKHKEYHVVSIGCSVSKAMQAAVMNLAENIKKNIVIVTNVKVANYILSSMKNDHNLSQVEYHTLFLVGAECSSDFKYYTYKSMLCLGHDIHSMHSTAGSNVQNKEVEAIRNNGDLTSEERDRQVRELLIENTNSPLYKYDAVYKDTATNVIWALKDRCIVHLMIQISSPENEEFYLTALPELARRYNHSVSYETLKEIDQAYLQKMHDDNKEDYIQFSVDNSKLIIDELKKKRDEHHKLYKEHIDKAMEHAKIFQKFADQISYFDESKFMKDETKKANDNYDLTLDIDKVSAIVVRDKNVYVYTNNIYVQDERSNRWHDIGTFQISIGMHNNEYDTNKTVNIKNTKYQIEAFSHAMQAPHVWEDGHICHGNLATGMTDAYKRRNMFELVYQILLFLGEANTSDSAGENVNKWPEVTEEIALHKEVTDDVDKYEKLYQLAEADKKFDESFADAIPVNV